eukprot:gene6887-1232_t
MFSFAQNLAGGALGGQDDFEAARDEGGDAYEEKAAQAVPAAVRMISGCNDSQTSADVHDVAQFGLPADA